MSPEKAAMLDKEELSFNVLRVEAILRDAMAKAHAEGIIISPGSFGVFRTSPAKEGEAIHWRLVVDPKYGKSCCCPMGAILRDTPIEIMAFPMSPLPIFPQAQALHCASMILGIPHEAAKFFVAGFDDNCGQNYSDPWYQLGQKLRKEFLG